MIPVLIRRYEPRDLPDVYRVCHGTGLNGEDASRAVPDPELIGHSYAAPYAVLEPDLAFVAEIDGRVAGYVLGTRDSVTFHRRAETEWFPALRERYPLPRPDDHSATAHFVRALHRGHPPPAPALHERFPAHLHIDLLPFAQRRGGGRSLHERFFAELRSHQVRGVHLYVGRANRRAIGFYEHLGFARCDENEGAFGYGYALR